MFIFHKKNLFNSHSNFLSRVFLQGGNGLCCEHGNGKYELYSKNTLVAYGSTFGAIEDTEFTIDPRIFLGSDWNGGIVNNVPVVAVNIPGTGTVPIVNIPTISKPTVSIPTAIIPAPAQPSPTATGINSPPTPKDNAAPSLNAPSGPTVVGIPNTPSIAVAKPVEPTGPLLPTFMASFYCGTSFDDAEENCHHPCPSGSPAECADNPNLNFLVEEYVCFSSTTCRDRTVVPSVSTCMDAKSLALCIVMLASSIFGNLSHCHVGNFVVGYFIASSQHDFSFY